MWLSNLIWLNVEKVSVLVNIELKFYEIELMIKIGDVFCERYGNDVFVKFVIVKIGGDCVYYYGVFDDVVVDG